jgi:hypothetical protein
MDEKIEPWEIVDTELDDELGDEALDRPGMVAGSASTNHCGPVMGPQKLGVMVAPPSRLFST